MTRKLTTVTLAILLTLAACAPGPHAVVDGVLRDTMFSIEPRTNGTISIWMTHDDVGVYCTLDKAIADKAMEILTSGNGEVIMHYASRNNGDPEVNALFSANGCAIEGGKTTVYKIISIERVGENE